MKTTDYIRTRLFSTARVLVILANLASFSYHYWYIGIDLAVSIILQGSAFLIEYLVTGWYERLLFSAEEIIANIKSIKDKMLSRGTKHLVRYLTYTAIFMLVYASTYALRLLFFYKIHWGINESQIGTSLINMILFALAGGWVMGAIVMIRKNRVPVWRLLKQKFAHWKKKHFNHT